MAVYEYEILSLDGTARAVLEVEQKMSDPPLTHHPETGEPLRRVLSSTFARVAGPPSFEGFSGGCESGSCGVPSYGGCAGGTCGVD